MPSVRVTPAHGRPGRPAAATESQIAATTKLSESVMPAGLITVQAIIRLAAGLRDEPVTSFGAVAGRRQPSHPPDHHPPDSKEHPDAQSAAPPRPPAAR